MECFVCIHCHFYQPPRENPWLEAVESQESASPYHDWNERIARECYLPNGASRILDSQQRISKIINNYGRISFNFGPTLLSWMEECSPEGYRRILDGDRESQRRFSGHGSALAQAYTHSILPLSNSRDKRTQILWGISDFQRRFGRDPEGMWLPETAVDLETLDILSGEGIKFTVLAPRQAHQVRPEKTSPWIDLEYGIDSRRAYACNLPSGRSIGLFFYDGALSTAVAFERLLLNGENFAHRLLSRFDPEGDSAQLMHIATDGETYGHHHAHGDMALAFALQHIEDNNLARLTNYAEYFAHHPPAGEVRIHENSSWSCVHGVERWQNNCGCNSGGHSDWNQEWRRPLREALNWLRDDLAASYETEGKLLLKDPWLARDEYVTAVLDRSTDCVDRFLFQHSARKLTDREIVRALRLLEMQRHLMLMYTSCGWFFDEPTGPETVQILQYAGRAVQLGQQLFGGDREEQFLARLEEVTSNIAEFGNGRDIYERFVQPAMLDLPGVAAHWAISSFFDGFHASDSIYSYGADLQAVEVRESGKLKLATGQVQITSGITRAQLHFNFAVLHGGGHNLCAGIFETRSDFPAFVARMQQSLTDSDFARCCELFSEYFAAGIYSLKSMFRDERHRIVSTIVNATLEDIDGLYRAVYGENTTLIGFLRSIRLPLPPILRVSSEFVLGNEIRRCLSEGTDAERIGHLLQTAAKYGVRIDTSIQSAFRERLNSLADEWSRSPLEIQRLAQVEALAALAGNAPFETDLWYSQNVYYEVMMVMAALAPSRIEPAWRQQFQRLGDHLGIAQFDMEKPRAAAGPRRSKTAKQTPTPPKPDSGDASVLVLTPQVPEIPPVT